jgi:hypothetical protein
MQTFFDLYDQWNGLVPLVVGTYMTLVACGYLPKRPKDPEKLELWRKKFGPLMKMLGPLVVLSGVWSLVAGQLKDDSIAAKVRQLNMGAPRMVDPVTKFERAVAGPDRRITFEHTVTNFTAQQVSIDAWLHFQRQLRQNLFKDTETKRLHRKKITLVYRYTDLTGALIGELVIEPTDPEPN